MGVRSETRNSLLPLAVTARAVSPRPRPAVKEGGADKGSGTALPARRGGWGTLTPRPVVGAGGSPPILMCLHRPGFTPVPCGEGSTLSHRNLERRSEGRTWHSAQHVVVTVINAVAFSPSPDRPDFPSSLHNPSHPDPTRSQDPPHSRQPASK